LLLLAIGYTGYRMLGGRAATEVKTLTLVEASAADENGSSTVLNASGYVTARRRATVASKITGRLTEVEVEEGLPVERGQMLARLDDSQLRAALALARAQLAAAERTGDRTRSELKLAGITLGRTRRLLEAGVANRDDMDRAESAVETLEAQLAVELQQAQVAERQMELSATRLEDSVIRAPFTGMVISKDAQPGEMVSPNSAGGGFTRTGICTIVDMESLEIEVDVNENYISRVRAGQRVQAILDAYPSWKIPGKVITTIPAADRQKATVMVRVGFDQLDPRILPDMGIKVAFLGDPRENTALTRTISIPRAALVRDGGRDIVFVVKSGRAERRAVSVESASGDQVAIAAGLSVGETIVIEGADKLSDGSAVTTP
jgi:HlyD family secretion protein